jgi:hypothetical protein
MCTETFGTAPNRLFGVEWFDYDFNTPPPGSLGDGPNQGANLDFEAFLYEGTGEIDTVYNTMSPGTGTSPTAGRESGGLATTGLQNETGTVATSDHDNTGGFGYGAGNGWSYIPSP